MTQRNLQVCALVAMDENRVIGVDNRLPWKIPEDMRRFKELTVGHTVLMGRKTYESLPAKFRPLPDRVNVVLSRTPTALELPSGVLGIGSIEDFLNSCRHGTIALPSNRIWIVGGAEIYKLSMPFWDQLYLTRVSSKHNGDAYFPAFEDKFELADREPHEGFVFERYVRK